MKALKFSHIWCKIPLILLTIEIMFGINAQWWPVETRYCWITITIIIIKYIWILIYFLLGIIISIPFRTNVIKMRFHHRSRSRNNEYNIHRYWVGGVFSKMWISQSIITIKSGQLRRVKCGEERHWRKLESKAFLKNQLSFHYVMTSWSLILSLQCYVTSM